MASWISRKKRMKIYDRDAYTCIYCGKQCKQGDTRFDSNPGAMATLDHIVSQKELAAASTDDKDFSSKRRDAKNLVVACMSCNSTKRHTPLYVFCQQQNLNYATILAEISRRISIQI